MTGGSISRSGFITVGNNPGANGQFTMTGGTITPEFGDFEIGDEAPGNATISGGTISTPVGGWRFSIGNRAAGTGVAVVNGTAVINTDNFTVGKAGNGTATLDGDAVINARSSVTIGHDAGSVGNFTMNGGTIADDDDFLIGNFGNGTFTMNGGVISKAGWIVVGNNPGSNGTFTMNGGTINQSFGDLEVGDEAAGVLNQTGGTINVSGNIYVSNRTGGVGDANISGGLLTGQAMVNNGTFDASGNSTTTLGTNALGNNPGSGFIDGTGSMSVAGTAAVNAAHVRQASLTMTGGTVKIADTVTGTAAGVSRVGNYSLDGAARYDLRDNKLITDKSAGTFTGGAYSGVQGDVQRAYNFGAWDQPGLTTSEENAGQNAGVLSNTTTIGVARAEQVLFIAPTDTAVVWGQTVTGATTIAMYTYAGDLNFDGLVDGADYGVIDNYVQFPGTDGYVNGDFNYDGVIDGADYGVIDNTIQLQGAPFVGVFDVGASGSAAPLSGVTAVPEPAGFGFALLGASAFLARSRRRHGRVHHVRGADGDTR
jgi:T5SS/PEP-CTERM-associated repeat protein